ncbi:MAG: Spo0B domain-containing protein, partial [Lachnospiraceae bacterium]|nr:Spo0B domain-containing protein [Lachnospiraceae bacterium]
MSFLSRYVNKQLSAYQNELIQTHYEEVENMYRQVRGWRHDYRNHIQVMKSYAAAGDLEAIKGYLNELDE